MLDRILIPAVLFFVSGFCALVYEVVWSRMLVVVMGNTTVATSTILGSFMTGLSLGSYFCGRFFLHLNTTRRQGDDNKEILPQWE